MRCTTYSILHIVFLYTTRRCCCTQYEQNRSPNVAIETCPTMCVMCNTLILNGEKGTHMHDWFSMLSLPLHARLCFDSLIHAKNPSLFFTYTTPCSFSFFQITSCNSSFLVSAHIYGDIRGEEQKNERIRRGGGTQGVRERNETEPEVELEWNDHGPFCAHHAGHVETLLMIIWQGNQVFTRPFPYSSRSFFTLSTCPNNLLALSSSIIWVALQYVYVKHFYYQKRHHSTHKLQTKESKDRGDHIKYRVWLHWFTFKYVPCFSPHIT